MPCLASHQNEITLHTFASRNLGRLQQLPCPGAADSCTKQNHRPSTGFGGSTDPAVQLPLALHAPTMCVQLPAWHVFMPAHCAGHLTGAHAGAPVGSSCNSTDPLHSSDCVRSRQQAPDTRPPHSVQVPYTPVIWRAHTNTIRCQVVETMLLFARGLLCKPRITQQNRHTARPQQSCNTLTPSHLRDGAR